MRRCPRPSRAGRGHQIAGQSDADPPDDPLVLAALAVLTRDVRYGVRRVDVT